MDRAWPSQASPLPGYTVMTIISRFWCPKELSLKSLRLYFKFLLILHLFCNTALVSMYKLGFILFI